MAKKIEGWIRPAGVEVNGPGYELGSGCGWCEFNECGQPDHGDEKATLVVGHERVFTESEVRAILHELKDANRALSGLRTIALRHGISLDPA